MLCYAINWYKGQNQRCTLDVCLELWVVAIGLVLAEFEAACATKHHIYNADISKRRDNPLTNGAAGAKAD